MRADEQPGWFSSGPAGRFAKSFDDGTANEPEADPCVDLTEGVEMFIAAAVAPGPAIDLERSEVALFSRSIRSSAYDCLQPGKVASGGR